MLKSIVLGLVAEADSDARYARFLAEQVLPQHRLQARWVGLEPHTQHNTNPFLKWGAIPKEMKKNNLPINLRLLPHGADGDYKSAYGAVLLFKHKKCRVDGIVVVRDADNRCAPRTKSLRAAQSKSTVGYAFGLPNQAMEAWVLSGVSGVRNPEKLTHKDVPSGGKAVLEKQNLGTDEIESCLNKARTDPRGAATGLHQFMEALEDLFKRLAHEA